MASAPTSHSSSVMPSAGALATKSAPRLPLAPGLFSTMTLCLNASPSGWLMARAMMSDEPPGGYGTMILMGLPGIHSAFWAQAAACTKGNAAAAANSLRRGACMAVSPWVRRLMGPGKSHHTAALKANGSGLDLRQLKMHAVAAREVAAPEKAELVGN